MVEYNSLLVYLFHMAQSGTVLYARRSFPYNLLIRIRINMESNSRRIFADITHSDRKNSNIVWWRCLYDRKQDAHSSLFGTNQMDIPGVSKPTPTVSNAKESPTIPAETQQLHLVQQALVICLRVNLVFPAE
uniref:Uncharacterized protein n=1 Tax=Trichobilharzia regenti TaxID=157069 RepID=A0AA85JXZ1_TRIRE|nr:unnamed protein product [Trichobilharzia regenti]